MNQWKIFKFKGKLYHTNHSNEVGDNTISSLENDKTEIQIDDYFSKFADTFSRDEKSNRNQNIDDDNVDEYFIDKESGQELTEWSDLTDSEDSGSSLTLWDKMTAAKENDDKARLFDNLEDSKGQLIEELVEHSIIQDDMDGRIVKVPKKSWWEKLPFMSITKSRFSKHIKQKDKEELYAARVTSMVITAAGVLSVLAFIQFPTVYEAHGYFHSTLTPPLVVAIFLGVFWKRFTPAGVITTFLGGVVLMLLGARFPEIYISPFDHGIEMNPNRPYSYIRAFYNLIVCVGVGVFVTMTTFIQKSSVTLIKKNNNSNTVMMCLVIFASISFILAILGSGSFQHILPLFIIILVPIIVTYYGNYDEELSTNGLTIYSISNAKEAFKGSKLNEKIGEKVELNFQLSNHEKDEIMCSKNDLLKLGAEVGDLVYLSDKRKW